jgi:hypothetical protein
MFEQIVRPFERRQILGQRRIPSSSVKEDVGTAELTWGAAGALPTPAESAEPGPASPINFVVKGLNQKNEEIAIEYYPPVKLQQEDNPDNFVVLQRPKKITYKDPKPKYLKSPTQPGLTYPAGSTGFKPGPGDPQEIPLDGNTTSRENEEVIKYDTHEYILQEHPGDNETPL